MVKCGSEYLDELLFVGDDVALHDVHARTKQSLKCSYVKHCTSFHHITTDYLYNCSLMTYFSPYLYNRVQSELTSRTHSPVRFGLFTLEWTHPTKREQIDGNNNRIRLDWRPSRREINTHYCSQMRVNEMNWTTHLHTVCGRQRTPMQLVVSVSPMPTLQQLQATTSVPQL